MSDGLEPPQWLSIPDRFDSRRVEQHLVPALDPRKHILDMIRERRPVVIAFTGGDESANLISSDLDPLLNVMVEEIQESTMEYSIESVLIQYFDKKDELTLIDWEVDEDDKTYPRITVQLGAEKMVSRGEVSDLADEVAIALDSNVEVTLIQTPKFTVRSTARAADETEDQE